MDQWSEEQANQSKINPSEEEIKKTLDGWTQERNAEERELSALALAHCIQNGIYTGRFHPSNDLGTIFGCIYNSTYRKLVAEAPIKYQIGDEKATPKMLKIYDKYQEWLNDKSI